MKECWLVAWKDKFGIWNEDTYNTIDSAIIKVSSLPTNINEIHIIRGFEDGDGEFNGYEDH